jgi:hypothetical protein
MIAIDILVWILIGAITGVLYFSFQQWSVNKLNPQKKIRSLNLIIGGAVLRLLVVGIVLAVSVSFSLVSLFIFFGSFMFTRLVFLLRWQGFLQMKKPFARHS